MKKLAPKVAPKPHAKRPMPASFTKYARAMKRTKGRGPNSVCKRPAMLRAISRGSDVERAVEAYCPLRYNDT